MVSKHCLSIWVGNSDWRPLQTDVRFKVLTAVAKKISVFWDITPCSPVDVNVSEEHTASILRVQVWATQETSMK
jgi:hypothetical protein